MNTRRYMPKHKYTMVFIAICTVCAAFVVQAVDDAHNTRTRQLICAWPTEVVHVSEGDTIWGIASDHHIDGVSTSELVQWLREQNNLSTACLLPGQALVVPSASASDSFS